MAQGYWLINSNRSEVRWLIKNTNNVLIVGSNNGGSLQVNYDSFIEVMDSDYEENVKMNQAITTFFIEQVGINNLIHR